MGGLQDWKKRAVAPAQRPPGLEPAVRRQLAGAAGADYFRNRDPVYHVTEAFQKTFDLMGAHKARERAALLFQTQMKEIVPGLPSMEGREEGPGRGPAGSLGGRAEAAGQRAWASFQEQSSMDGLVEPGAGPGDRMFLHRFSEMAFQRGTMAAAVLGGTGKMMLFSCLKRTAGQSQPLNFRQRKLFESSSQRRNLPGRPPDQALFNRGQADGAVALVVDVLRDARRVTESLSELAAGESAVPGGSGAETLQKLYPFLSDGKERALLAEYRAKLDAAQDVASKEILQHALVKTQALLEKKQQMKQRFITALRSVSESATAALDAFTQPGFAQELVDMQGPAAAEPEPPPEDGDKGGQGPEPAPEQGPGNGATGREG